MSIEGSTFDGRIDQLIARVGDGTLSGHVEFDQAYAHRQHYEVGWNHPRGGQAMYLSVPFQANMAVFMENLAATALGVEGPKAGMIENVEILARASALLAPKEWGVLQGSAHPWVDHDGAIVYDRPPIWPRLSDEELDTLHEMWSDMFPNPWPGNRKITSKRPIRIVPTVAKIHPVVLPLGRGKKRA